MTNETQHYKGAILQRVTKAAARKAYNAGKAVYMQSSNLIFNSFLQSPFYIKKEEREQNPQQENEFNNICNEFIYYNCSNETGKYIKFYI